MILVDSSVWIDHLREGDALMARLLEDGLVLGHALVLGELACGRLRRRNGILALLADLPQAVVASDAEVLDLIERCRLTGRGIGHVDAHPLAGTLLTPEAALWTRHRRLAAIAREPGIDGGDRH
ncbi:MAG: type II toxin-antitoxin system VapC family toxin [Geminicoccaceae bacterium]